MTREEAKHMRLFTQWQEEAKFITWETTTDEIIGDHNLIIDEIFDAFESRTCSSCKYANIIPNEPKWIECSNIAQYFTLDYGCNKWEAKDER